MLKGINRQMIEISEISSPYFERALLVLRADCADQSVVRLQEEARRVLMAAGGYSALYKNRRTARRRRAVWMALGLCAGLLLGGLLTRLML